MGPRTAIIVTSVAPLCLVIIVLGLRLLLYKYRARRRYQAAARYQRYEFRWRMHIPEGAPINVEELVQQTLSTMLRSFAILSIVSLAWLLYQVFFKGRAVAIDEQAFLIIPISMIPLMVVPRLIWYKAFRPYLPRFTRIQAMGTLAFAIAVSVVASYVLLRYHPITGNLQSREKAEFAQWEIFACAPMSIFNRESGSPLTDKCVYNKYGLTFKVPPQTRITDQDVEEKFSAIRIQNYAPPPPNTSNFMLNQGEYFLEVAIFDHGGQLTKQKTCEIFFTGENYPAEMTVMHAGDVEVMRGIVPGGGEAPARQGLCYQGEKVNMMMVIGERDDESPSIADAVLKSVTISNR